MQSKSDHDLLIEMAADLRDLVKIVKDNGQPGLVTRTSRLEAAYTALRSNVKLLAWIVAAVTAAAGVAMAAAGVAVAALKRG